MLTLSPIFEGQRTVPSPEVTDLMLELLDLKPTDNLLEIGTGSGYQTRRFAESGCTIHSVELNMWLDSAITVGSNVFLHQGDGQHGLPAYGPYSAIVATCGVEQIPKAWIEQLATTGRLVAPVGETGSQRLTLFHKVDGELKPIRIGAYVRFQMMKEPEKIKPIRPRYENA